MATYIFNCGAECGGTAHWSSVTGTVDYYTTDKSTGIASYRVHPSSPAASYLLHTFATAGRMAVVRAKVKINSVPGDISEVLMLRTSASQSQRIYFDPVTNRFKAGYNAPGQYQTSSMAISTGQWYRLEMKVDTSSGTTTCDWAIDGTAQTQATTTQTAHDMIGLRAGTYAAVTADFLLDDVAISQTAGDYPIGDGATTEISVRSGSFASQSVIKKILTPTFAASATLASGSTPTYSRLAKSVIKKVMASTFSSSSTLSAASGVYTVPDSIDYTGATDVTSAMAAYIASVPDGSTITFKAGATYKAYMQIFNRNHLTLNGNGATINNVGYVHSAIYARACTYLSIHDFVLQGDNTDAGGPNAYHSGGQEYSAGIWLAGCTNVEVYNNHTLNSWGDSIYLGSFPNATNWCDTVYIHDNNFELNGRCGFVCDAGRNVIFEYNSVDKSAMHVFDIEPFSSTAEGASNVQFRYNTIGTYGLTSIYVSFFFSANGIAGSTVSNITVTGNTVVGNNAGYDSKGLGLHTLVDTARRTNITFTNNTCTRAANGTAYPGAVLFFEHTDGLVVTGNTQPLSSGTLFHNSDNTGVTYSTATSHTVSRSAKAVIKKTITGGGSMLPYGSAINMDSLANTVIGGPSLNAVSYRFRATSTTLNSIRVYIIGPTHSGYGAGTGGTWHVAVKADDGTSIHAPTGSELASYNYVHPTDDFHTLTFTTPATLTVGNLYHIVFTNTDAAQATNYCSIDSIFTYDTINPRQPRYGGNAESDVLLKEGSGAWYSRAKFDPIMDLTYADGSHQGQGYMEVNLGYYGTISGNSMVRERFTVSGGDRMVTTASVRVRRTSGTDPLTIRLETSNGTLIEQGTVAAANIEQSAPGGDNRGQSWATITFASPHLLVNGTTYRLRLSTTASTTYTALSIRCGASYSYNVATYYNDGQSEKTTDGTTWVGLGRVPTEDDLQFYFNVQGGLTFAARSLIVVPSVTVRSGSFGASAAIVSSVTYAASAVLVDGDLGIVLYSTTADPVIYPVVNIHRIDSVNGEVLVYSGPPNTSGYDYGVPLYYDGPVGPEYKITFGAIEEHIYIDIGVEG
jgi:hypothetical protein